MVLCKVNCDFNWNYNNMKRPIDQFDQIFKKHPFICMFYLNSFVFLLVPMLTCCEMLKTLTVNLTVFLLFIPIKPV